MNFFGIFSRIHYIKKEVHIRKPFLNRTRSTRDIVEHEEAMMLIKLCSKLKLQITTQQKNIPEKGEEAMGVPDFPVVLSYSFE